MTMSRVVLVAVLVIAVANASLVNLLGKLVVDFVGKCSRRALIYFKVLKLIFPIKGWRCLILYNWVLS